VFEVRAQKRTQIKKDIGLKSALIEGRRLESSLEEKIK
jgi:hypothetical protein